jgi:hypothetical protein
MVDRGRGNMRSQAALHLRRVVWGHGRDIYV